ncbi:MAG: GNAT family N-acetyltransferase [Luteimonas sp.]
MIDVSRLARSVLDSERFGLEVWRASVLGEADSVLRELVDSGADVAIYRLPTSASHGIKQLAQRGFEVINAGVLVYYTMDLANYEPPPLRNSDLHITPTMQSDDEELAQLVDISFDGYVSHYLANPLFAPDKALAGYREWTLSHRLDNGRTASWVARRNGRIVAFACCEFDRANRVCNGGIYGVLPGESKGGLFGDLIRYTQRHFKAQGFSEMRMSTKVDNFAVQKVWIREGYHLYATYDTLHVNALLSAGTESAQARKVPFDAAHADGLLLEPAFSRLMREQHRGTAPTLQMVSEVLLAPLIPGGKHTLSVRVPAVRSPDALQRAVATVHDQSGTLCVLGYGTFRTDASDAIVQA